MDMIGYLRSCRECLSPFTICGPCNTGHAYCSDKCRDRARKVQLKKANKTYAATPKGRKSQYNRNRRYLQKQASQEIQDTEEKNVTDQTRTVDFGQGSMASEAPSDLFGPEQVATECSVEDESTISIRAADDVNLVRSTGIRLDVCCRCGESIEYLYVYSDELGPLRQPWPPVQRGPPGGRQNDYQ